MEGYVKYFLEIKGYGFVVGNDGNDYFIHYTDIASKGYRSLNKGDYVQFDPEKTEKGWKATNLKVVE